MGAFCVLGQGHAVIPPGLRHTGPSSFLAAPGKLLIYFTIYGTDRLLVCCFATLTPSLWARGHRH